jgi:thiamine-monophosphate kinase
MPTLEDLGEKEVVRRILAMLEDNLPVGPGDDAAALDIGDRYLVVCSDIVSFGTHMPPGMSCRDLGWSAVAVNYSDLASMGARPMGAMVSLALPRSMDVDDALSIVAGTKECVAKYGGELLGGDTKEGSGHVTVTALGTVAKEGIMLRSGARDGDLLAVTGRLGRAAAGFLALEQGEDIPSAKEALFRPRPRVEEGMLLSASGAVTSCMDISDGLAASVHALSRASGIGFQVIREAIPEGVEVDEVEGDRDLMVLYFGGDYELLFTIDPQAVDRLYEAGLDFSVIGRARGTDNILVQEGEIVKLEDRGHEHFRP